jgi:ribosome biogenesis protein MAK21
MSKPRTAASGANAIRPNKSRQKPSKSRGESKDEEVKDLRTTIQRRYLRDADIAKIQDKKDGSQRKPLKGQKKGENTDRSVTERGKKRDRNGRVLSQDKKPSGRDDAAAEEDSDEDILAQEMKSLGGTAEDLDLLADADSESELEGDAPKKAMESLDKGMKNILKEIALAQGETDGDEEVMGDVEEDSLDGEGEAPELADISKPTAPDHKTEQTKKGRKIQTQFLCEPKPEWFDVSDPDVDTGTSPKYTISKDSIEQLHEYAQSLLDEENRKFKESQQSSSAQSFYNTVITSGTLSDKISALTLAVQESPIHNVKALETLIVLASKRSRSQAVDVLRALKDLFAQGSLLPSSRKLYAFHAQPTLIYFFANVRNWKKGQQLPDGLEEGRLVAWAFESWLKEQYFEILKILEVWCNDEIEFSKARAVSYVYELLKERPEQESNLLRLLINKLGDPVKKIASQASYLLMQLLITHPAMKMVVVSAIESDFIFRPGQSLHGKYYAVVTLNQTALSAKEEDVAVKLLDIYFGLFTGLLKTDKEAAPKEEAVQEPQSRGEQRRKKNKNKNSQPAPGQAQAEELRDKLISAILTGVNRAYPYTSASSSAFSDHLETLFKVTHSANFNTSIQSLLLIQQISQASQHKASSDRFYRVLYESLLDPRLIIASKQQLYLNLLHRALKADLHINRVRAFIKRLTQVLTLHEPSFICGAFFLIQDLVKTFPSLKSLIDEPEDHEEDDVEVFRDVPSEDEDEDRLATATDPLASNPPASDETPQRTSTYDAHKRDALHANASNASLWEILPFLAHFHPSVSVSAENLLGHRPLSGKPDLNVHSLSHFLDRFVYRNPKLSHTGLRGNSIMQPMATDNKDAVLLSGITARSLPVNSEQFRAKKADDIAAEDVFFHQYFTAVKKSTDVKNAEKKKKLRDIDDDGSAADDEDEIWKAMMASAPDLEGDEFEDDDTDLDLADLESGDDVGSDVDIELAGDEDEDEDDVDIDPAFFEDDDNDDDHMDVDDAPGTLAGGHTSAGAKARARPSADNDADGIPSDVSDFAGFGSQAGSDAEKPNKKAKGKKKDKAEKKKLKNLPTFATAEEYAKMLEDDDDEDR